MGLTVAPLPGKAKKDQPAEKAQVVTIYSQVQKAGVSLVYLSWWVGSWLLPCIWAVASSLRDCREQRGTESREQESFRKAPTCLCVLRSHGESQLYTNRKPDFMGHPGEPGGGLGGKTWEWRLEREPATVIR